MEKQIKVKVAGHPESTLTFYPKASTGSIRDGVAFENGNTGGWVIAYSDFLKMVELAKQHHAQQSVHPTLLESPREQTRCDCVSCQQELSELPQSG